MFLKLKCVFFLKRPAEGGTTDYMLDNVDWHKNENGDKDQLGLNNNCPEAETDFIWNTENYNETEVYQKILEFIRPNETVSDCSQRLSMKKIITRNLKTKRDIIVFTNCVLKVVFMTKSNDVYKETFESLSIKIEFATKLEEVVNLFQMLTL